MKLRPYQQKAKEDIYREWDAGIQNVLYVLPTGGGKCLGRGTPILMHDGQIKTVETIRVGDLLIGPDSKPRKVLSTCRGREELFRVVPVKGDTYVVNKSHILSLKQTGLKANPKYESQEGKGKIVNIEVVDYLKSSNTFKHTHKGWRTGVNWTAKELPEILPPYFLGMWLGDGHSKAPAITTVDREIVDYLYSFAADNGLTVRAEPLRTGKGATYYLRYPEKRKYNPVTRALRDNNLLLNKHIPLKYKTGSYEQRAELLAGLLDTDGSLHRTGYDFIQKNKLLAEDFAFVARSLGFAAYISEAVKTCGNNGVKGTYFRVHLTGDFSKLPIKIIRKKAQPRKQIKDPLVTGISLESIGEGDYFGFEIDGDHLFMLGDFTVTHNTVTMSDIVHEHTGAACAIAHRQELVTQISLALARDGIKHRIIGPKNVIKLAVNIHMAEVGRSFYDPSAATAVAGVDTLIRREAELHQWLLSVTLWLMDESHHPLQDNKWGKAIEMFPNARGLGVTATPIRADGKGLGRHADGNFDVMVEGPNMRDLINMGFLTDYRIFAPPSDLDLTDVKISTATGDYNKDGVRKAVRKSHIMGDVVKHYLSIARGKLGITFATDVETATDIAAQFNAAGVPAEVVSAKTPDADRIAVLRRFKNRELLQLVNVDLFGEGFDLPAIEVVSMARPTQSYSLFAQQFGRALRILPGKTEALIIDHVGNVIRHGLPDAKRVWSLDRREKRSRSTPNDAIPVRACTKCTAVYERAIPECPFCGYKEVPTVRSGPEHVDGDLCELDAATLEAMRGAVAEIDKDPEQYRAELMAKRVPQIGQLAHVKRHVERQEAQGKLRESIALWAGYQRAAGRPDAESYRRFWFAFGTDVMSAQALNTKEATELTGRINKKLEEIRVW